MTPRDPNTRLGVESLEARDCPSELFSFSWGEFSWDCALQSNPNEAGLVAQTNPSNGGPSSIPTDQFSISLVPTRG